MLNKEKQLFTFSEEILQKMKMLYTELGATYTSTGIPIFGFFEHS